MPAVSWLCCCLEAALTRHFRQQSPLLHWEPAVRVHVLQHSPPSLAHSWGTQTLVAEYMRKGDKPHTSHIPSYLSVLPKQIFNQASRHLEAEESMHCGAWRCCTIQEIIFLISQHQSLNTDSWTLTGDMFPSSNILYNFKAWFCIGSYCYYSLKLMWW